MTNVHKFGVHKFGRSSVERASRAWWIRRIRSAIGFVGFAAVMVFAFLVAMSNPVQQQQAQGVVSREPYYSRCADARAAGAAPIYRGEPGYRGPLDADNDGVACEPYGGR